MSGIFLAGRAGSGKSTLAKYIVAELDLLGLPGQKLSFADALKDEVWELFGVRKGDEGSRELLIRHGEERRSLDPTYWVRRLVPSIERCWEHGIVPVIDDVRREPEYARLVHDNFCRIRVVAPIFLRRAALAKQGLDPDFALSEDPTERDHEVWFYDMTRALIHTGLDFQAAASQVVARAIKSERVALPR